jgi:di/tripeptidase
VVYVAKTPRNKKHLHVLIDEDIYKLLVETAPGIYGQGKYRGALSYVVEEALRHYLLPRAHTQSTQNPRLGVRSIYNQVVEKIKEIMHYDFKPDQIPEKILDRAIAETRGSDPRTINKWKAAFQRAGLIKFIGGYPPNRIVELL